LQRIYDSEINAVSWFWDDGFEVKLGELMNGLVAETKVMTWEEVERWLRSAILLHRPNSQFAKQELSN
jgi:hypothetical protein